MNPLFNQNNSGGGLPQQLRQNIQQVKQVMRNFQGVNPMQTLQQNPQINEVLQMCKGKNPQEVFMSMCKQRGIDPNEFLKELQN